MKQEVCKLISYSERGVKVTYRVTDETSESSLEEGIKSSFKSSEQYLKVPTSVFVDYAIVMQGIYNILTYSERYS